MTKKQIDFQVQLAVDEVTRRPKEAGAEFTPEFLEELHEVLEGMAIRELAARHSATEKPVD